MTDEVPTDILRQCLMLLTQLLFMTLAKDASSSHRLSSLHRFIASSFHRFIASSFHLTSHVPRLTSLYHLRRFLPQRPQRLPRGDGQRKEGDGEEDGDEDPCGGVALEGEVLLPFMEEFDSEGDGDTEAYHTDNELVAKHSPELVACGCAIDAAQSQLAAMVRAI